MTADELTAWAQQNGWQIAAGNPSLMKPGAPKEPIVRLVLKATVAALEVKKPAGKWEKIGAAPYAQITLDEDAGTPRGLGFEKIPSLSMLMQKNRDMAVFAKFGK
jgi:hypothetical protein